MKLLISLICGLLAAGCGYELPKTGESAENSNRSENVNSNRAGQNIDGNKSDNQNAAASNSDSSEKDSGPLIFSESSLTTAYSCNGREVEFEDSSTANSIALTGECAKLVVDGVSNTINVDKVGEIVVKGISNRVVYGEGLDGKKPKITKSGVSTEVISRADLEKKKAK